MADQAGPPKKPTRYFFSLLFVFFFFWFGFFLFRLSSMKQRWRSSSFAYNYMRFQGRGCWGCFHLKNNLVFGLEGQWVYQRTNFLLL